MGMRVPEFDELFWINLRFDLYSFLFCRKFLLLLRGDVLTPLSFLAALIFSRSLFITV